MWMDTYFSKESLLYSGLESENREVFFFLALLFASVLHRYNLLITPCRKGNCRNFSRREARERKRERRRRRKKKKKGGEKKRKRRSRGVLSTFWEVGNAIVGCRSRKNDRRNPMRAPRHLNRSDSVPVQLFSCSLFSRYHPSLILAVCHFFRRSFFSLPSFDRRVNLLIIPRSWPPLSNQDVNWIRFHSWKIRIQRGSIRGMTGNLCSPSYMKTVVAWFDERFLEVNQDARIFSGQIIVSNDRHPRRNLHTFVRTLVVLV